MFILKLCFQLNSVQKLCGTVFFAVPAFIHRLRSCIAVRKLFLKPSPNFSSRFHGSLCFWQSPDIFEKPNNSEIRPQTKSSWQWLPHKKHQYSLICFTSFVSIFKLLKCNTFSTRILNVSITSLNKMILYSTKKKKKHPKFYQSVRDKIGRGW